MPNTEQNVRTRADGRVEPHCNLCPGWDPEVTFDPLPIHDAWMQAAAVLRKHNEDAHPDRNG